MYEVAEVGSRCRAAIKHVLLLCTFLQRNKAVFKELCILSTARSVCNKLYVQWEYKTYVLQDEMVATPVESHSEIVPVLWMNITT